jgi:alpha-beta hydrolase superfamily lysophospholipase
MKNWLERFDQQNVIATPALVVQGQQDNTVDWAFNIPRILKKMPRAQLYYIAEARHHLANESPAIRAHLWQIVSQYIKNRQE